MVEKDQAKQKKSKAFISHEEINERPGALDDTPIDVNVPSLNVKTLPSMWKPYPANSKISYKPYVFGEIKQFNQSKLKGKPRLEFIIKGIETSFPKEDLTLADTLYIGLMRKISTLGEAKTKITWICDHCGSSNDFIMLNNELDFEDLLAEKLPVIASLSDGDYQFKPLTIGHFFDLMDIGKEEDEVFSLAKMCISRPFEIAYDRFYKANQDDGALLEQVDELLYHGIKPMEKKCSNCEGLTLIEVEGGEILVSPFRDDSEPPTDRIRFGA